MSESAVSRAMVVSDLDGTLLFSGHPISSDDISALERLGQEDVVRVIATGRSWASVRRVLPAEFPIDYLVFLSGAGVVDWKTQELLVCHNLSPVQVTHAAEILLKHGLDFMVHDPIPDTRPFLFHRTEKPNPDFDRRYALNAGLGKPFKRGLSERGASELLAICPRGNPEEPYQSLLPELAGLSLVRATSPLDGRSMWLEVFSHRASKSQGAAWIASRHGVAASAVMAVGNDYNDLDLLRWAGTSFIMDNAPAAIRDIFPKVPASERHGVSEAVRAWTRKG